MQNLSIIGLEEVTQKRQAGQSLGGRVTPCHGEWWGRTAFPYPTTAQQMRERQIWETVKKYPKRDADGWREKENKR
jgi:hypothetical protein